LTLTSITVYGKVTDKVKEAAAGFAPVHDDQFGDFNLRNTLQKQYV
jgi:hypothetical protein